MPIAINGCELRHGSGRSYSPSEAGKNQVTLLRPHGCTSASGQNRTIGRSRRPGRDCKLKESPVWLASGGPQLSAVGFDDPAADC